MKKFLVVVFFICILGIVYVNRDFISNFALRNYYSDEVYVFGEPNSYFKNFDYGFVQNTDNLYPSSYQDILNIIYSTLNRGLSDVTFYCDDAYDKCIDDVNEIAENSTYLSTINNLVHPYNSYKDIHFRINTYGKVSINVNRSYSDTDISLINDRIDQIAGSIISEGMSDYDKILSFHDYIVNNTVYDDTVDIERQMQSSTNANNAFGLLFEGRAICSGYSDVMAIILNKYGINNYKISSDDHIWNLVYLDGQWLHVDVTWDDPVTTNGSNILLHDFFLIDTNQLFYKESTFEKNNHLFNNQLYMEA